MSGNSQRSTLALLSQYLLCYVLFVLCTAIGIWLMLQFHISVSHLAAFFGINQWIYRAIHQFSIVILGLMCLVGVMAMESYFRHGVERGQFWSRVRRVLTIEAVLAIIMILIRQLPIT